MSLSATDKAEVKKLWANVEPLTDQIGAEAFSRMLVSYPQTKTYFSEWGELTPQNSTVRKHGGKIMRALNKAVKNIDNLKNSLNDLSELHANKLRVDPGNFKILAHSLIVVLAMYLPADFTPEAHLAVDKFMAMVAWGLSERYR